MPHSIFNKKGDDMISAEEARQLVSQYDEVKTYLTHIDRVVKTSARDEGAVMALIDVSELSMDDYNYLEEEILNKGYEVRAVDEGKIQVIWGMVGVWE